MRLAIIGAGISGLTAAYAIEQLEPEGLMVDITLFESSHAIGGVIQTLKYHEWPVEMGPDSLVDRQRGAVELCHRLGLGEQLVGIRPGAKPPLLRDASGFKPFPAVENRSFTLSKGLSQLPDTLQQTLRRTHIHVNHPISAIRMDSDGWYINGAPEPYHGLILAVPASALADLLKEVDLDMRWAAELSHQSRAIVGAAYEEDAFSHAELLQHTGFMVSPEANLGLTALTWLSTKWSHFPDPGPVLCRTFWGPPASNPDDWTDTEIVARHEEVLRELAGPHNPPVWTAVVRHAAVLPKVPADFAWQYPESARTDMPYLGLLGPYQGGPGVSDCVRTAWEEAYRFAEWTRR